MTFLLDSYRTAPGGPRRALDLGVLRRRGRETRLVLIRRSRARGLVPLVEISRGPAAALRSAVLRFAAILDLMGRQDPSAASCLHSFHSMPTCETHRRRERHWHANWYALELRSLIAQSSVPVSAMPRRVRRESSSRRTRGVGTAGTTVAREQLDLPFMGLRPQNTHGTSDAVDSERVELPTIRPTRERLARVPGRAADR